MTYSTIIYILYCGLNIIYVIVLGLYIYIYTHMFGCYYIGWLFIFVYIYMIYDYDIYICIHTYGGVHKTTDFTGGEPP